MTIGEVIVGLLIILSGMVFLYVLFQRKGGMCMSGQPHFEVFKDKNEQTRFRFRATNGEIILQSEAYESKQACMDTITVLKESASDAPIQEV